MDRRTRYSPEVREGRCECRSIMKGCIPVVGHGINFAEVWLRGGDVAQMGTSSRDGSGSTRRSELVGA